MADAAERLVNLALFLASRRSFVTAEECRSAGLGYPDDQDTPTFLRMFERDKDALRAAGLVIGVGRDEEVEAYRLDAAATFARPVTLDAGELATLRAVAAALAGDPGFPFGADLTLALGKIGVRPDAGTVAVSDLGLDAGAPPSPLVASLAEAVRLRKIVAFDYTNSAGEIKHHSVEPYGLFFRDGWWYLSALDRDLAEVRTYHTGRIRDLETNPARPRTPDFERPGDFDIRNEERLPFQYGQDPFDAELRFAPDVAWRAARVSHDRGSLTTLPDGSALWRVEARNATALAGWIVAQGPGIYAVGPDSLVETLRVGLARVADLHA